MTVAVGLVVHGCPHCTPVVSGPPAPPSSCFSWSVLVWVTVSVPSTSIPLTVASCFSFLVFECIFTPVRITNALIKCFECHLFKWLSNWRSARQINDVPMSVPMISLSPEGHVWKWLMWNKVEGKWSDSPSKIGWLNQTQAFVHRNKSLCLCSDKWINCNSERNTGNKHFTIS